MSNYQKLINENIKKLRLKSGFNQEKFAEFVGISSDTITNIENNRYLPRPDTIEKICKACKIEYFELLTPEYAEEKEKIISFIGIKLESFEISELKRINAIIDVLKEKY